MVHFPGFAPLPYFIQATMREFCSRGFPHSEICGSKDACSLPQLIAACHVLHRLEVPRHPPCALSSLTVKLTREQRSRENLSVHLHSKTCLVFSCRYSIVKEHQSRISNLRSEILDEASKLQPSTGRHLMLHSKIWLPR